MSDVHSRHLLVLATLVGVACRYGYDLGSMQTGSTNAQGSEGSGVGSGAADANTAGSSDSSGGGPATGADAGGADTGAAASGGSPTNGGDGGQPAAGGAASGEPAAGGAAGGEPAAGGAAGGEPAAGGAAGCAPTNGGVEVCDGLDNDCSGMADDAAVCGADCVGDTLGGHGYRLCTSGLNFADAFAACQADGMQLAAIESIVENDFIFQHITQATWLGGNDIQTEDDWRWPDGSQFWSGGKTGMPVGGAYTNFGSGDPNEVGANGEDCLMMAIFDGSWASYPCVQLHHYMCERY